jgi:hypothetical protein
MHTIMTVFVSAHIISLTKVKNKGDVFSITPLNEYEIHILPTGICWTAQLLKFWDFSPNRITYLSFEVTKYCALII